MPVDSAAIRQYLNGMAAGPDRLAAALKRADMTQNELERQLGVASGTASRWATGDRLPSLKHALELERLLGIPPEAWVKPAAKGAA